ncbi:MAG: hypothetical protein QOJ64_811 [Acidobacteriota bacterium]|nr:hypothetical protein [Acidobacteriota bacterium]
MSSCRMGMFVGRQAPFDCGMGVKAQRLLHCSVLNPQFDFRNRAQSFQRWHM